MNEYHFLTLWRLTAPLEEVWDTIRDVDHWARWWPCVREVQTLDAGGADGVGALRRLTWHGALPYSLTFDTRVTHVESMREIRVEASGDAEGTGLWRFDTEGSITVVRYGWDVRTNRAWMSKLAPLAQPLFRWNHNYVMRRGGEGLAAVLNAHLVECLDTDLPPAAIGEDRTPRDLRAARARASHDGR
ncbi:SRPBCC family protein [Pandoraea norimbergensis]|uniref:Polyketide cyclase n=1 Tax=Pandoraea norimbergensis TaxID=93219 RepID=A0ABN4JKT8_9BURK|nr:SRPBCC family protein [Pandoraea norimbergensis]ALS60892.1 polyketide cyclase [Pandoraea norimbergensis]